MRFRVNPDAMSGARFPLFAAEGAVVTGVFGAALGGCLFALQIHGVEITRDG